MVQKLLARKGTVFSRIPVTEKKLTLNVYDNAIVDGDTVSIYYNGRMLVNRQRLSEKPIVIELELDEKAVEHEIILFAARMLLQPSPRLRVVCQPLPAFKMKQIDINLLLRQVLT